MISAEMLEKKVPFWQGVFPTPIFALFTPKVWLNAGKLTGIEGKGGANLYMTAVTEIEVTGALQSTPP